MVRRESADLTTEDYGRSAVRGFGLRQPSKEFVFECIKMRETARSPTQKLPSTAIYCHLIAAKPLRLFQPVFSLLAPRGRAASMGPGVRTVSGAGRSLGKKLPPSASLSHVRRNRQQSEMLLAAAIAEGRAVAKRASSNEVRDLINGGKLPDRAEKADGIPRANTDKMKSIESRHLELENDVVSNQRFGGHFRSDRRRLVLVEVTPTRVARLGVELIEAVSGAADGDPELAGFSETSLAP